MDADSSSVTGGRRARGRPHAAAPAAAPWQALLWIAPALAAIAFVFGYSIYRLLIEATHRDGT